MPPGPRSLGQAVRSRLPQAVGVAFACFLGLGLNDSTLGTAWPSIRHALSLPVGDLGLVQLASTAGFLSSSALSGRITARAGRAFGVAGAALVGSGGLAAFATAPDVAVLLLAALMVGLAGGLLEPGMQAHVALVAKARTMNLLHACYGIGATIGPLVLSGLLLLGVSWRLDYLMILLVYGGIALAVLRRRSAFDTTSPERRRRAPRRSFSERPPPAPTEPLPRLAVAAALLLFFVYCGVEMSTGQWAFTFFTSGRHLGTGLAGLLLSGFWASLTLARLAAAALGDRLSPDRLLTISAAGSVAGELLIWLEPTTAVGAIGLLVVGASLAPAFPLMMARTASWAGADRVSSIIGWQSAAAGIGVALPSALAGLIIESFGLDALPPYLVGLAVAFLLLQLGVLRVQARPAAGARADLGPRTATRPGPATGGTG